MARLQNTTTKVVVNVADDKVDRFGDGWTRLDDGDPGDTTPAVSPQAFDPGDLTVADVVKALDVATAAGNGQEVARILEAERAGKARTGILNHGK